MSVLLHVYTITGGELIKAFYNATAGMFHYNGMVGLFKTGVVLGAFCTLGLFFVNRDIKSMLIYILKYAFAVSIILTPTSSILIHDRADPLRADLRVDNVPLVLGIVGSLSSLLSDKITQMFELFFHAPNDMDYSKSGMIMGAKLYLSASHIKITDPKFNSNMQKFMQQCVIYDLMLGRYSLKELNETSDIWALVKNKASLARGIIYDGVFKSCKESAELLDAAWQGVIDDASSKYGGFAFGNHKEAKANFEKYLPLSYGYLTTLSSDASSLIRQNMMSNALRDGVFSFGARVNSKAAIDSFSASRATEKAPASFANIGLMVALWLPFLQVLLFCIVIGLFVFVLFFLLFPSGFSFLKFYLTLYIWLGLWPPIFTVINYLMSLAAYLSFSFFSNGATTLAYQTGLNESYENMAALSGYLLMVTATLSYMVISKRVESFLSVSQQPNNIVQSSAQSATEEIQLGNYHYGNTSFESHSGFNNNAYHSDENARISLGNIETGLNSGSIGRIAQDGSQTISMGSSTSQTPLHIQLGESTRAAFSELADSAQNAGFNESIAGSKQYSASLRDLAELGNAQSHGEQSGDSYQISNSSGFNTATSRIANLVDTFAHDHNMSRDAAIKTLGAASFNLGVSGGIGTGSILPGLKGNIDVGGNLRYEKDLSESKQDAQLYNAAKRFSEENHFTDVVNQARQATKDEHFRAYDEGSQRLADNFSVGFDKSMQYRDEAHASFTESESYHRQANLSNEQIASINLDAQTGFIDWLAHHKAPNSQGNIGLQQAEGLIRHDPELAEAYAKEYINEKTSRSIHQFQKDHALNNHHLEQKYNAFKERVGGEEQVNSTLHNYNHTFEEKKQNINAGTINNNAAKAVEKDLKNSYKELSSRLNDIVQDGTKIKQDLIVSEANQ